MKNDSYIKAVLTVIAISTTLLLVKDWGLDGDKSYLSVSRN